MTEKIINEIFEILNKQSLSRFDKKLIKMTITELYEENMKLKEKK